METVDPKGVAVFYDFTSTRSALVAGEVISILSIPRKVLFAEPDRMMIRNLTSVGIVAGLVLVHWLDWQPLPDLAPDPGASEFHGAAGRGRPQRSHWLAPRAG